MGVHSWKAGWKDPGKKERERESVREKGGETCLYFLSAHSLRLTE